jgi:copper chaperone NosL
MLALALATIGGCEKAPPESAAPAPARLSRDAVGYYCGMIVADHPGPKAQIFLESQEEPLWFSSVRDGVAFTMLPEESKAIRAIYVHDMGQAGGWASPSDNLWTKAEDAHYVIGGSRRGGMGAMEAVPFADPEMAADFAREFGGRVVSWATIPRDYILGGPESEPNAMQSASGVGVSSKEKDSEQND